MDAKVTVEEMVAAILGAVFYMGEHGIGTTTLSAARDYILDAQSQLAERDAQIAEMRENSLALDIVDAMVRRGDGAVVLSETECGHIGLWIGDCDENVPALGTGDTVYEAITEAVANHPELGLEANDGDK